MVEANGILFLAGQLASDWSQDITGQTKQTLANIDEKLALAGSDKSKIVSVTIWISDMADFAAMNAVWDAWIDPENPPARACVKAEMADPRIKVEMMPVALK